MFLMSLCDLSIMPLDFELYAGVRILFISNSLNSEFMSDDIKFLPLSEIIDSGNPYLLKICFSNAVAIVFEVASGIGMASRNLVKQSLTVRMKLFLKDDVGKGPSKSMATFCHGHPPDVSFSTWCWIGFFADVSWQASQDSIISLHNV